jgi:hypothetical protein
MNASVRISPRSEEIAELTGRHGDAILKIPVVFPNTHPNFVGEVLRTPNCLPALIVSGASALHVPAVLAAGTAGLARPVIHTSLIEADVGGTTLWTSPPLPASTRLRAKC